LRLEFRVRKKPLEVCPQRSSQKFRRKYHKSRFNSNSEFFECKNSAWKVGSERHLETRIASCQVFLSIYQPSDAHDNALCQGQIKALGVETLLLQYKMEERRKMEIERRKSQEFVMPIGATEESVLKDMLAVTNKSLAEGDAILKEVRIGIHSRR
jgi:hypothetical protein